MVAALGTQYPPRAQPHLRGDQVPQPFREKQQPVVPNPMPTATYIHTSTVPVAVVWNPALSAPCLLPSPFPVHSLSSTHFFLGIETAPFNSQLDRDVSIAVDM